MRYSKQVKKEIEKAEKLARKQAFKKPKKKRRASVSTEPKEPRTATRWIDDEWGEQGCVFFDGKTYWLTMFREVNGKCEAYPYGLSEEKWEEYKKHPIKARLVGLEQSKKEKTQKRQKSTQTPKQKSGTSETGKRLSSTRKTTQSTKPSKKKRSGKSPTKSGKTVTPLKQRKWQLTSTSPKK